MRVNQDATGASGASLRKRSRLNCGIGELVTSPHAARRGPPMPPAPGGSSGEWVVEIEDQVARKGPVLLSVGESVLISAPNSQSAKGRWLGQIRSFPSKGRVRFCFFFGTDFNPQAELDELETCSGGKLDGGEVILSDWAHTIDLAHVVASTPKHPCRLSLVSCR